MAYRAEYIWIDGTEPLPLIRSKTRILPDNEKKLPIWGFDGSSTNQAPGENSDVVLRPVFDCPDPIRGGNDRLVMCDTLIPETMEPHPTNHRAACAESAEKHAAHETIFGIEQEYTLFENGIPLGWPRNGGYPAPQGPYYCGVGATEISGRDLVEAHTTACMEAGLAISGTNAEVMLGQWEFQIGPVGPLEVSDQIWIARYLLYRLGENYGIDASIAAKPIKGDWNGAGAHTNVSTKAMRENYDAIIAACEAIGAPGKPEEHIAGYGVGTEDRLTGLHETAHYTEFRYGVSDRGASIRIPWQVAKDGKGYIEDRRPNANMDPYIVTRLLVDTICENAPAPKKAAAKKKAPAKKKAVAKKAAAKK